MEQDQTAFAKVLQQLRETARLQGNMLTSIQVSAAFSDWHLGEEQFALVHGYLQNSHISIDQPGETGEAMSGDDVNFLAMYLEELQELAPVSDGEKRAVMMSALAGDRGARAKLVELYLPQVVELSRLYAGQGVLVEDLIGEGNLALASAVDMLACVEGIEEVEGFLVKMVLDAMENHIADTSDKRETGESVLCKVNEVNDKAKELYENLLRKVTPKEVADELGIEPEAVMEAVRFSADRIDYIENGD